MDPFWENAYNDDKDKRYGALFFAALLGCFSSVAVAAVIAIISRSNFFDEYKAVTLVCGGMVAVPLVVLFIRWFRGRKRRHEYLKNATLSRDELAKARSKLKRQIISTKPVSYKRETRPSRRPPPRKVDVDLKY